jgi:SAM-dependent methyltransferase
MANHEMRELWNSEMVSGWVEHQAQYDAMLAPYAELLVERADFNEVDRILDVGCGTGALTRKAAAACPHGSATGVDISRPLLAEARRRSEGIENVTYLEADAQTDELVPAEVILSRFGVMFFEDPATAFGNLHRVTEPDGRLLFVCWRGVLENAWVTTPMGAVFGVIDAPELPPPGAPGPFSFENRNHLAVLLTEAGWADLSIEPDDRQMLIGGGLDADHATDFVLGDGMGRRMMADATAEQRAAARAAVLDALRPHETADGVALGAATWVVQAHFRND